MPLLAENGAPAADIVPPDGMRDRFLARIGSEELVNEINEGSRLHPFLIEKPLSSTFGGERDGKQVRHVEPVLSGRKSSLFWLLSRSAAVMAGCRILGPAAVYSRRWKSKDTPPQPAPVPGPQPEGTSPKSPLINSYPPSQPDN